MASRSTTGEAILDPGLARHRMRQSQSLRADSHKIEDHSSMTIKDVVLAIASIWTSLVNKRVFMRSNVGYAFAGTDILDPGRLAAGVSGSGVVGKHNRLTLPLFLPPGEEAVFEYFNGLENGRKIEELYQGQTPLP